MMFKSGFVSIIGRPNVGKSTLLNSILEAKLAIISSKPQTTRNAIRGIYNDENSQIAFVDTPGIHKPKTDLGQFMNKVAISTLQDMDLILFLLDVTEDFGGGDRYILELLKNSSKPVILVLNKIDKVNNEQLFKKIDEYRKIYDFNEIVPVSSINGDNVDMLIKVVKSYMPHDIKYYDDDSITDITDIFYYKEIIREKVLYHTQDEVPHSVAIAIDDVIDHGNELEIFASIIVERSSQKGILVGKNGSMIKQLSSESRTEIKKYKNRPIYLNLVVKLDKNWRKNSRSLLKYGYSE